MASQFLANPDPDYAYDLREFWPNSDPDWIWPLKKSQKSDPDWDMALSSTFRGPRPAQILKMRYQFGIRVC